MLEVNRSVVHTPLTVNGVVYERGLGAHSISRLLYDLDADGLPKQRSDLKSVRTTVGQHGGSMTLHWENNWCTLRILFPLPQKQ